MCMCVHTHSHAHMLAVVFWMPEDNSQELVLFLPPCWSQNVPLRAKPFHWVKLLFGIREFQEFKILS